MTAGSPDQPLGKFGSPAAIPAAIGGVRAPNKTLRLGDRNHDE